MSSGTTMRRGTRCLPRCHEVRPALALVGGSSAYPVDVRVDIDVGNGEWTGLICKTFGVPVAAATPA